jgi:hypothetical protein
MKKCLPKTLHCNNSLGLFFIRHWTCILWDEIIISIHHLWFFLNLLCLPSLVFCAVRWASFVVSSFSDDNFYWSSSTLMRFAFVSSWTLLNLSNLSRSIADSFELLSSSDLGRFDCLFCS